MPLREILRIKKDAFRNTTGIPVYDQYYARGIEAQTITGIRLIPDIYIHKIYGDYFGRRNSGWRNWVPLTTDSTFAFYTDRYEDSRSYSYLEEDSLSVTADIFGRLAPFATQYSNDFYYINDNKKMHIMPYGITDWVYGDLMYTVLANNAENASYPRIPTIEFADVDSIVIDDKGWSPANLHILDTYDGYWQYKDKYIEYYFEGYIYPIIYIPEQDCFIIAEWYYMSIYKYSYTYGEPEEYRIYDEHIYVDIEDAIISLLEYPYSVRMYGVISHTPPRTFDILCMAMSSNTIDFYKVTVTISAFVPAFTVTIDATTLLLSIPRSRFSLKFYNDSVNVQKTSTGDLLYTHTWFLHFADCCIVVTIDKNLNVTQFVYNRLIYYSEIFTNNQVTAIGTVVIGQDNNVAIYE